VEEDGPLRVGHFMSENFPFEIVAVAIDEPPAAAVWTQGFFDAMLGRLKVIAFMDCIPATATVGCLNRIGVNENFSTPRRHS
jgi:hypothetical protein